MDQYQVQRRENFKKAVESGEKSYRNDLKPSHSILEIKEKFDSKSAEELQLLNEKFAVAGRIMGQRSFGKAAFIDMRDASERMQMFYQKNSLGEERFATAKTLDLGDIIWVMGKLFKTRTGELTLEIEEFHLVTKCLHTLPEKWHGLTDVEQRYRQRYLDLIMNPKVRDAFKKRSEIIASLRKFFYAKGFQEVETPMMHPIPGGAAAKPFVTHHNQLNTDLYLRIAPELYLKRLLVGGWEKVFELNRNFRNEGISIKHNPEFTMLEFYQCYLTYKDLIKITEELLPFVTKEVTGDTKVIYQDVEINFAPPYQKLTFHESLVKIGNVPEEVLHDRGKALKFAKSLGDQLKSEKEGLGAILTEIFELVVEGKLIQPTFITHFPIEVSPLSRRSESNPELADRFELYVYGRELANAFSELNDPDDQESRFKSQVEALHRGDEEAMRFDNDFINALQYGMPPAAGEGIGVDRLVMFLTNSASIRDVILFPQLKQFSNDEA